MTARTKKSRVKRPCEVREREDGRFEIVDRTGKPVPGKDGEEVIMRFKDIAEMICAAMNSKGGG